MLELNHADLGQHLRNCDETGIRTSVAARKVIVKKGTRVVSEVGCGSGKEHITTFSCGSAVGERLPPYVVFKAENIDGNWTTGSPPDTLYSADLAAWKHHIFKSGSRSCLFLSALKPPTKTGPVILFLDGHNSHTAIELIGKAKANGITIFCLPSHTTHLL